MFSSDVGYRFRDPVALRAINVTGGYVQAQLDRAALARYRALLEATFPGAKIVIRTQFRPEEYGHARTVNATPPKTPETAEERRRLGITRMDIGDAWRALVGWPEGL